ncbi:MAG: DRTGG domain-containing protein [Bacteroidota bacterium]|nr:DRTGG domain-containing protein [Bacteroidota bacterium]
MRIKDILTIIDGTVACGNNRMNDEVETGFASDLMSDVLTLQTNNLVLITGLANVQTIRTAEVADISHIILARNKKASPELLALASENNQVIIECPYSMFKTCGLLYNAGLKAIY